MTEHHPSMLELKATDYHVCLRLDKFSKGKKIALIRVEI